MKKRVLFLLSLPFGALVFSSYNDGIASNGLGNRTGSAGSAGNCSGSGCHAPNNSNTRPELALIAAFGNGGPYTSYTPGTTYRLVIGGTSIAPTPPSGFGFQLSAVTNRNTQAGTFQNGAGTRLVNSGPLSLVEHRSVFMAASNFGTQEVLWTAPVAGSGPVRFYLTVNAVNTNNATSGDAPNNIVVTIGEDGNTAVSSVPEIQGFSVSPNPAAENLRLHLEQPLEQDYELCIFDASGTTQICRNLTGNQLQNTADIRIETLPAGFYVAYLTGGNAVKSLPFLKK